MHFDVACVVFLTGWNSATLGGQSGQLTSDFQKIDPYQYHTNVCFYRTMLAYFYPLYAGYFLSNTSKYIICWHAGYLCQHAAQLCWYTWNFILNNDVPWFKCISQCFPYHLSSGTERVTHRRNNRHKMTCIPTTIEIFYFNIGYNKKHSHNNLLFQ